MPQNFEAVGLPDGCWDSRGAQAGRTSLASRATRISSSSSNSPGAGSMLGFRLTRPSDSDDEVRVVRRGREHERGRRNEEFLSSDRVEIELKFHKLKYLTRSRLAHV